ncbi:cardiolipin synthase [Hyunsoonleella flava]|uniref:Cardiolipin synthase n=1 Tax=Hyunsoonleella flava TaxID=2527939 RepID=A0A4Q9FEJ0_9FLAO|nr:cardiolipin synthase [Hyunsoonleella flava]TBN04771.1 cardiolipin synthase [Hyunsoonleella flava]
MLAFLQDNYWNILIILNYIIAISAAITVILKNINPTKTLSYILVLVFFPFFGVLVYYLFGQEYRKNKIFNRKRVLNQKTIKSIHETLEFENGVNNKVDDYLSQKSKLVELLYSNNYSPLTLCNDINILKNGNEKFEYLMGDLKKAEHHIHLEYYILKDDKIGTRILNVLCDKAKNGVSVRLTYDDVGSKLSTKMKHKLDKSGVEHYPFMPVLFSKFTGKMNYRNHRKITIIDGKIGYVGGINIADEYINNDGDELFWRDTHLRILGEAVKSLQVNFFTTWDFVSNQDLKIDKSYFPQVTCKNNVAVQIASSGPDTDWPYIMEAMFTAINTAEDYIYITTPYFVPNDQIITALQVVARSGVDVKLVIPKESDSWVVKHATNSLLEKLLEADIKVYRYSKGLIHAKTIVIDDIFSTIGTSNMDYRSFNINFEVNAFIYDKHTSNILKQHFLKDLEYSEKVNLDNWTKRPKIEKLKESYSRLWSPLI